MSYDLPILISVWVFTRLGGGATVDLGVYLLSAAILCVAQTESEPVPLDIKAVAVKTFDGVDKACSISYVT